MSTPCKYILCRAVTSPATAANRRETTLVPACSKESRLGSNLSVSVLTGFTSSNWWKLKLETSSLQNWIPRTELPRESSGGDQRATAIRLGTTRRTQPLTPDLAGKPT